MLTELCAYLKNWFEKEKCYGDFKIVSGHITFADGTELPLQDGQYFRIIDSIFNDGVYESSYHEQGESENDSPILLKDEEFTGSVWCLAIPRDVIELASDIEAWQKKYGGVDSEAMSPYQSENFGGYSYSKSVGNNASGETGNSWQSVFGNRLAGYRKV